MENKKRSIVEWSMHYRQIVILVTSVLVAFGLFSLIKMNKNEFPDYTIRQGIVAAVYPGASSDEIEEQVTKPLENYIFTYKEVKKAKTKSYSRNGLSIIQIELNDDINGADKENFWSRFKLGVQQFKSSLPVGVLALQVQDDFGDASSLLITMESKDKTYRELNDYMDDLKDHLRNIESVGRMNVYGSQKEQIGVYVDTKKLSQYGIRQGVVSAALMAKGFNTTAGMQKTASYEAPIHVDRSLNMVNDVKQMIIYSDPNGNVVKVGDLATVKKEYAQPTSFVTNNGKKCIVLSVEIKKGRSITDMGTKIKKELKEFQKELPKEVTMFTITDQSLVVRDSVVDFLKELCIAIVAVMIVVLLLMPIRVALVASSTIPISIFISLGLFYAFNIELNTVTLAALIVTLGMIVDNSIVIIDNYMELLAKGMNRWRASIESAEHFFKSIFTATLAISITFFPLLLTTTGVCHDFLKLFPWGVTIVLMVSLLVAELVIPFMQFYFIRKPIKQKINENEKSKFSFLGVLQKYYDKLIDLCFKHPHAVIGIGTASIITGIFLMGKLPQKLMPMAERNQFAVEIYLPTGTPLAKTAAIADSMERDLRKDRRVVSVASFKGTSSPRFQATYAPQFGGKNYAQFIVNTKDNKSTVAVLKDYRMKYTNIFPSAYIRFKQLSYNDNANDVEARLSGNDWAQLKKTADSVTALFRADKNLILSRNDLNEPLLTTAIKLDEQKANRLGITNTQVELDMATRYNSDGIPVATIWDGDYAIPVALKSDNAQQASINDIANEPIAIAGGLKTIPLRQVAKVMSRREDGEICHRNGMRTITVMADVADGVNVISETARLQKKLSQNKMPHGVKLDWGGELELSNEETPQILRGLAISVIIIFFLMLAHFHRVSTAVLVLISLLLVLPGTALGVLIPGKDFSVTCYLGIISLMGILVRNAVIMYDYTEELRDNQHLPAHQAIYTSAKRRMRPIFLTSAAASMGVVPMILGGSGLWSPMGNVIFYGTIITMIFILTVLPIAYWLMENESAKKRERGLDLEKQ